jgi:hypothetical protein
MTGRLEGKVAVITGTGDGDRPLGRSAIRFRRRFRGGTNHRLSS